MGDLVELTWDDTVATIRLNRPDAANSLSLQVAQELLDAVRECDVRSARAVLVTGAGKVFCTGGDLKEFSAQGERIADHLGRTADALHAAILSLVQLNAPVIAAVNGGLNLAIAKGGPGTGNGVIGGAAALVLGLIAMALGGLALARSRRSRSTD